MSTLQKVLLIEDLKETRELFIRLLGGARAAYLDDVTILAATSWDEASRMIEHNEIDVVLLDLSLPPDTAMVVSTRFAAVRRVWPPTIIITLNPDIEMRKRCLGFGAQDYMDKELAARCDPVILWERIFNVWTRNRYGT